jgi:hypothetical protein
MSAKKILIGLTSILLASASIAAEHQHAHETHAAPTQLTLNEGKQWETDAALRSGMENIRATMAASLHDIEYNRLSPKKYAALAARVEAEVTKIVAHCKLSPEADAQLHLVIADIMAGAEAMAGKDRKQQRGDGAGKVLAALDNYAVYFKHPGWQAIKH